MKGYKLTKYLKKEWGKLTTSLSVSIKNYSYIYSYVYSYIYVNIFGEKDKPSVKSFKAKVR